MQLRSVGLGSGSTIVVGIFGPITTRNVFIFIVTIDCILVAEFHFSSTETNLV